MDFRPKVLMEEPLAAKSLEEVGEALFLCAGDAGKTETSAPLSTKKARRWRRQNTDKAPSWVEEEERDEIAAPGVTSDPRLCRFPRQREQGQELVQASSRGSSCKKKEKDTYELLFPSVHGRRKECQSA